MRYYGELASGTHPLIVNAALVGLFKAILTDTVTEVNARAVAKARGIELTESSSTRGRAVPQPAVGEAARPARASATSRARWCPATARAWCC